MKVCNFKKEVKLNPKNYFNYNPIKGLTTKRKKINGKYIYERFYLIDFLDIKENSYVISSFGRVFSLIKNCELKCSQDILKNNYKTVQLLLNNGDSRRFPVHVLVARAFVEKGISDKKLNRIYVHHKNWDNEYNYYWNLEWRNPYEIGIIGKIQNTDIMDDDLIRIVCRLLEKGTSIAETFEIIDRKLSRDKISKIKNKQIYQTIVSDYNF